MKTFTQSILLFICIQFISGHSRRFLLDSFGHQDCHKQDSQAWKGCYNCVCRKHLFECGWCGACKDEGDFHRFCPTDNTTPAPIQTTSHTCNEFKVFEAVATSDFISNHYGDKCGSSTRPHHSDDALLMTLCKAPQRDEWKNGQHVWYNNQCTPNIKPFSPIFYHVGDTRYGGILISCDQTEIRVFYQSCDTPPIVRHITGSSRYAIYSMVWEVEGN